MSSTQNPRGSDMNPRDDRQARNDTASVDRSASKKADPSRSNPDVSQASGKRLSAGDRDNRRDEDEDERVSRR
jgi:hypothetical protein